jgi:hypothetical protein
MLVSLLAVFALGAVTAGAAQASGGPVWIHKTTKVELKSSEKLATKSKQNSGTSGLFKLTTSPSVLTVECPTEKDTGELIGGNPGTDTSTVTFEGCHPGGRTLTQCGAASGSTAGTIGPFNVKTLLGYPKGQAGEEGEAYDQFFPTGFPTGTSPETLFVTFELSGSSCGSLNGYKTKVVATGTKAKVTGTPLCGLIAKVGEIENPTTTETFKVTKSGVVATAGGLDFPTPAIDNEEVWNGEAFEEVKCGLQAQVSNSKGEPVGNVTAEQVGVAIVEASETLSPFTAEPFGWKV